MINGDLHQRYAGNLNLSFRNLDGQALFSTICNDLAVSAGQACVSEEREPSYILTACGVPHDLALNALRIGLGRFTTEQEVDYAGDLIVKEVKRMRQGES